VQPRLICAVHGDTSTTMAQPLDGIGAIAREVGALVYVDATATIGGMEIASDRWGADVVTGGCRNALAGLRGHRPSPCRTRRPRRSCTAAMWKRASRATTSSMAMAR
jgi:aspartate aminotransferase-like enzyme